MARSMLSCGMFSALAASMAVRRRGLPAGSPPPCLAAMVISRITLVKAAPRFWSATAFFRLICFHLLWPAMGPPRSKLGLTRPTPRLGFRPHALIAPSRAHPRRRLRAAGRPERAGDGLPSPARGARLSELAPDSNGRGRQRGASDADHGGLPEPRGRLVPRGAPAERLGAAE